MAQRRRPRSRRSNDLCAARRRIEAEERKLKRAAERLDEREAKAREKAAARADKLRERQGREARKLAERQAKELARIEVRCPPPRAKAKPPRQRKPKTQTRAKPTRAPAPAPKSAGVPLRRAWPEVVTPAGSFPVRLRLVAVDDVITSHRPDTWELDPRYPASTQERRYDRDPVEQQKVTKISRELRPELLLAATPSALDGPPIVAPDASGHLVALGGNGRSMALRLAYDKGAARAYGEALRKLLRRKALPKRALLVRELVPPPVPATWAKWSRDLNRPLGAGLDLTAQAVSLSRSLPPRVPELLAGRDLAAALRSRLGREVLRELQLAGLVGAGERGLFEDEGLSEQGRALVRRALAGAVLGSADTIDALPGSVVDQVARAAPALLEAAAIAGAEFDMRPALRAAAIDYADASRWRGGVGSWLAAPHLIAPETLAEPLGPAAMRALVGGRLVKFADGWLSAARARPQGQAVLFADPRSAPEIAADNLEVVS